MKKLKRYAITGGLYVPYDIEIMAKSKKEAKELFEKVCRFNICGFDYDTIVHEIRYGTWSGTEEEELSQEMYDFPDRKFYVVNNIYVGR